MQFLTYNYTADIHFLIDINREYKLYRILWISIPTSDVRIWIWIQIQIQIQAIPSRIRIQTLKSWIRIRIQETMGGFEFESGFKLLVADHNPTKKTIQIQPSWIWIWSQEKYSEFGSEFDYTRIRHWFWFAHPQCNWLSLVTSDSKLLDSDSDSRKLGWIRIWDSWIRIRIRIRDARICTSLIPTVWTGEPMVGNYAIWQGFHTLSKNGQNLS